MKLSFDRLPRFILLILGSFLSIHSLYAQKDSTTTVASVLQKMEEQFNSTPSLGYDAQMLFKDVSTDIFEERSFRISYRLNTRNPLYGYDWKIEEFKSEGALTILAIPEGQYWIFIDGREKIMTYAPLPDQLEPGSYLETMRNYFLIDQAISPFLQASPKLITQIDSNQYIVLRSNIQNNDGRRELTLYKKSYLPMLASDIYYFSDLNLQQIQEVRFSNYKRNLSDTEFSPEYYKNQGYKEQLAHPYGESTEAQPDLNKIKEVVLTYPFVSDKGDTTYLNKNKSSYLLLDFWYGSCEPCLKGLPIINELSASLAASKLRVIGINCFDKENKDYLSSKLRAKGINMELLFGSRSLVDDLNMRAFPTYLLINQNGEMQFLEGGAKHVSKMITDLFK